jgi:hypothetical protein
LRRWLLRGTLTLAALLAIVFAGLAFLLYPVWRSYPEADFPAAATAAERNGQDLDYLRQLPEIDRSFTAETRAAFIIGLDALKARAAGLDQAQLTMEVARLAALANNGHTNVITLLDDAAFKSVPLRLGFFADGLFVVKTAGENRDLLGAQVLAVNSRESEAVIASLGPFIGGPTTLLRAHAPRLIVSPELLRAASLGDSPDRADFRFRLADGSEIERTLTAVAYEKSKAGAYWPIRDLSPVPPDKDNADWFHVLGQPDAAPLYLSRADQNYWHAALADGKLLYLQINRMRDEGTEPLGAYLDRVLEEVRRTGVKNVAVDLRLNRGGNYMLAADFARALPETLPADGRVFILTGESTFSAAISIASRLKYFSRERGIQIGTPMGDRGQMWGEGGVATLPNSKIAVRYATGYHDWEKGCRLEQITYCFLPNYIYGAAPGSLDPQVVVPFAFSEYAAGRDPVMEDVLQRITP